MFERSTRYCRSGDMGTAQTQVDTGELSGMGSRKRGRNGSASSASRRHIQTEQKRRDKINEGCAGLADARVICSTRKTVGCR